MPGGDRDAYAEVEDPHRDRGRRRRHPVLRVRRPGGAGHVKMVHNGIEYADIQLIAEAYDLLTHVAGLDAPAIAESSSSGTPVTSTRS